LGNLRAVVVAAPPLLADLVRQALASRSRVTVVAEIAQPEAESLLPDLDPDVVILGPAAAGLLDVAVVRRMLPRARVFAISADLRRILGPGEGDVGEFSADRLAERLKG